MSESEETLENSIESSKIQKIKAFTHVSRVISLFKRKHKVIFLLKHGIGYESYKTLKINPLQNTLKFASGSTITIDIENPSYSTRSTHFYFVDTIAGGQITFRPLTDPIDPKSVDDIISKEIFRQLLTSIIKRKQKTDYMMLMICLVLGGAIGYIASMYI